MSRNSLIELRRLGIRNFERGN